MTLANDVDVHSVVMAGVAGIDLAGTVQVDVSADVVVTAANGSAKAVALTGGTATVSFLGDVTNTGTARTIEVGGFTGGGVTFAGSVADAGGAGVHLAGNTGATFAFTAGDLALAPANANPAFSATGGGTISVTGADNTLASVGASALVVDATTIGADRLTFRSISATGAANGIRLDSTGSSGGLTVTGTGTTDGSGGTIASSTVRGGAFLSTRSLDLANMTFTDNGPGASGCTKGANTGCHAGVHVEGSIDVVLTNVDISGGGQVGLNGNGVSGLTVSGGTIAGVGSGVLLADPYGAVDLLGLTVTGSAVDNVYVGTSSATPLTLRLVGGTISSNNGTSGGYGLLVGAGANASVSTNVTGVTFTQNRAGHVYIDPSGNAETNTTVHASTFNGSQGSAVFLHADTGGDSTATITNNTMNFAGPRTIAVWQMNAAGLVRTTITGNLIGTSGASGSGGGNSVELIVWDRGAMRGGVEQRDPALRDLRHHRKCLLLAGPERGCLPGGRRGTARPHDRGERHP